MKKTCLLVVMLCIFVGLMNAQCVVDTTVTDPGISPSTLPCITQDSAFGGSFQIYIPDSLNLGQGVAIDSLVLDTITGFPTGITYTVNPANGILYPGQHGCIWVSGTTHGAVGSYPLNVQGTLYAGGSAIPLSSLVSDTLNVCAPIIPPPPAPCVIDSAVAATMDPGIAPAPTQIPCVERSVPFDQTLTVKNIADTSFTLPIVGTATLRVDSMRLDSVLGLPAGITWVRTPVILKGGAVGCIRFTGTTTDAPQRYNLQWIGTAWVHISGPITMDTAYHGNLARFQYRYFLDVINTGDSCHYYPQQTGINDFSSDLNAAMYVYPNPSNGVFQLKLNAGKRVDGEIVVVDMTGRTVFNQRLDVVGIYNTTIDLSKYAKGLYTVQLRTSEGFASKNVSVE